MQLLLLKRHAIKIVFVRLRNEEKFNRSGIGRHKHPPAYTSKKFHFSPLTRVAIWTDARRTGKTKALKSISRSDRADSSPVVDSFRLFRALLLLLPNWNNHRAMPNVRNCFFYPTCALHDRQINIAGISRSI